MNTHGGPDDDLDYAAKSLLADNLAETICTAIQRGVSLEVIRDEFDGIMDLHEHTAARRQPGPRERAAMTALLAIRDEPETGTCACCATLPAAHDSRQPCIRCGHSNL